MTIHLCGSGARVLYIFDILSTITLRFQVLSLCLSVCVVLTIFQPSFYVFLSITFCRFSRFGCAAAAFCSFITIVLFFFGPYRWDRDLRLLYTHTHTTGAELGY